VFSQCIDREKITYGGDWGFVDYIHLCPTYVFAFGGDTSVHWDVLRTPIDIRQAPKEVLSFKRKVDSAIQSFGGNKFFSRVKFESVEVVYPERLQEFRDSGRQDVTLKYYRAKYLFYYKFNPDTIATYHIGIALSKNGKILSKFHFPSKASYHPIDTTFSYCKLINIAKKAQKNIEPIESIKLEFDSKTKRFYWLVTQSLVNEKEGLNYYNQVLIDAADLSKTKTQRGAVSVIY